MASHLVGWLLLASPLAAELAFDPAPSTVTQTSVTLTGSATADMVRGLRYEVRAGGADGALLDFGALRARPTWVIRARHLQLGENLVTIEGRDAAGQVSRAAVTLVLTSDFLAGSVRPRPRPAEIWFGGLSSDNPSLVAQPGAWPFVQQHVDGIVFHSFAHGFWTGTSRQDLANLLEPLGMRYIEEMGDIATWPDPNAILNQTDPGIPSWGAVPAVREAAGIFLTEITHDYSPQRLGSFLRAQPAWDRLAHLEWMTGETYGAAPLQTYTHGGWRQAFRNYLANFPYARVTHTKSTVYLRWRDYPILAGAWDDLSFEPLLDDNNVPVLVNGQQVSFRYNFDEILTRHLASALGEGLGTYSFWSDFPWGWYGNWSDKASAAINRAKVRDYERYLQQNGGRHGMICNTDLPTLASPDAWDLRYKDESLRSLYLHQVDGGRADKYVFESWYPYDDPATGETKARPYFTVPETKNGSYSNLALTGIRYLKGLRYPDATPEPLTLEVSEETPNRSWLVSVTNDGEVPCLPCLTVVETGDAAVEVVYERLNGAPVTDEIRSPAGFTLTDPVPAADAPNVVNYLLAPGATRTLRVRASAAADGLSRHLRFEVFWNPQDPTGLIRDTADLTVSPVHVADLASDDFSSYADGVIAGQAGTPTGFGGAWISANPAVSAATTVSGGVVTSSGYGDRTMRTLSPPLSSGTIYLRVNMALGTAPGSFAALELATTMGSDENAIRLVGGPNLYLNANGAGGVSTAAIMPNDGLSHDWLIELNLDTGAGRVWIDANTAPFNPWAGGTPFTAPVGFSLNAIHLASFAASGETPFVVLDDIEIATRWSNLGLSLAPYVFDDFSTYTDGQIAGQAGTPTGFGGVWTSANPAVSPATTVSAGVVTSSGYGDRTVRALSPTLSSGTIYLRVNMAIANAPTSFTALELATNALSDVDAIRLVGLYGNLYIDANGAGGVSTAAIIPNDGLPHEWLIELNLDTGAGRVWIDANTAPFNPWVGGMPFTAPSGFSLNAIQLATFQGADIPSLVLDDLQIGGSWENFFPTGEFQLTITPNSTNPGNYDFTWDSRPGMAYDLVSATDLSNPISTWAVWDGKENLSATPPINTLTHIPGGGDPRRFFAVVEKNP